jgi:hypothetical protein
MLQPLTPLHIRTDNEDGHGSSLVDPSCAVNDESDSAVAQSNLEELA